LLTMNGSLQVEQPTKCARSRSLFSERNNKPIGPSRVCYDEYALRQYVSYYALQDTYIDRIRERFPHAGSRTSADFLTASGLKKTQTLLRLRTAKWNFLSHRLALNISRFQLFGALQCACTDLIEINH
jgi:hypothetical protein